MGNTLERDAIISGYHMVSSYPKLAAKMSRKGPILYLAKNKLRTCLIIV